MQRKPTLLKGISLRLKVNKQQEQDLMRQTGACRWVYNHFLALQIEGYEEFDSFMSYNNMCGILTQLKYEEDTCWLRQIDSTALQRSLRDLSTALKNFFESKSGKRKGRKVSFPKFKSLHKTKRAISLVNNNDSIRVQEFDECWRIKLNKFKFFSVYNWRKRLGMIYNANRILSTTIYQDSDQKWYASVLVECETQTCLPNQIRTTGIDLGLKTTVVLADGSFVNASKPTEKYRKKLKKLQQIFSRKLEVRKNIKDQYGRIIFSKSMIQLKEKISRLHFKIKCIRKDFNHKLSRHIVDNFEITTMEDLNIQQMLQKDGDFARNIQDVAWFQLRTFIEYKCKWAGKIFLLASKWLPSSKTCSDCGCIVDLKISMRKWKCPNCNIIHDRDINAAKNLDRISRTLYETGIEITNPKEFANSF